MSIPHLSLWNTRGTNDLINIQDLTSPSEEPVLQPESGAVTDETITWQSQLQRLDHLHHLNEDIKMVYFQNSNKKAHP